MRLDFDVKYVKPFLVKYSLKLPNFLLCNTSLMTYFNWKGRQTRHKIPVNKVINFNVIATWRFQCMLAESKILSERFLNVF